MADEAAEQAAETRPAPEQALNGEAEEREEAEPAEETAKKKRKKKKKNKSTAAGEAGAHSLVFASRASGANVTD